MHEIAKNTGLFFYLRVKINDKSPICIRRNCFVDVHISVIVTNLTNSNPETRSSG